jgi:hypothetical protein
MTTHTIGTRQELLAARLALVFLLSLKALLETGKGAPWPNEISFDSWE